MCLTAAAATTNLSAGAVAAVSAVMIASAVARQPTKSHSDATISVAGVSPSSERPTIRMALSETDSG
jgi:hypothetical protein